MDSCSCNGNIHLDQVMESPVPPEVCNYIQMLAYETEGLMLLNAHIAKMGNYSEEVRKKYEEDYLERKSMLELAKAEMLQTYAPDYTDLDLYEFKLTYVLHKLVIYKKVRCNG